MNAAGEAFEGPEGALKNLPVSSSSTYDRVSVLVNGRRERWHVHVLMALTFLGLDPEKRGCHGDCHQVDHLDGDKRNNALKNLEVVTKRENYKRARERGGYARNGYASKGRPRPSLRRFTPEQVAEIHRLRSDGLSYREIGCRMGCDHKAVYRIVKGETYQAWA